MNKNKVREIIKFSFFKDLQNKWFIIFNIITLVSILILINFSNISSLFNIGDKEDTFDIAVLDNSNLMYDSFYNKLSENSDFNIFRIDENTYTSESIPDNLVIIEAYPDFDQAVKFSVISKEGIINKKYLVITDAMNYSRNKLLSEKYDVSEEELDIFQSELNINRIMLAVDAEDSTTKEYIKLLSSALTYLVATLIFSKLANEIAQEKQSKSSEYILTTVSEKEYLFAKIFSNISIVIIQGIFLMIYYYIAALLSRIFAVGTTDLSLSASILSNAISKDIIIYIFVVLIYNILNIILLSIIQATLAAKTSSTAEAGNTMSIIMFLMIAAYIVSSVVIDPYSKVNLWLAILSCFPLLSAFFIPALLVIGQCSLWQIIISALLLVIAIPITFNFCSKHFKNGILDYTKVKKKKENIKPNNYLLKREMRELGFVIGLAIIIYVGAQTILSLIASIALEPILGSIYTETELSLLMQIILQVFSLGLASFFVLAYCRNHEKDKNQVHISKKQKIKLIFIAIFLVFTLQIVLSVLLYPHLGLDYDITDMFDINSSSRLLTKIIAIIAMALTPAIYEELFFRKAVIDFTSKYSKNFALVFSSLLFGLLHMNLSQGLFAFLMGLIMGFIYIYTNDIKLTMLIHFINNGFATLAMFLPEIWIALLTIILLGCIITGLVFLIKCFTNKSVRKKIISFFNSKISAKSFNRYKYVFADYTFDVSLILVGLMSILTENILR